MDNVKTNFLHAYTNIKLNHQGHIAVIHPSPRGSILKRKGWDAAYRSGHPAVSVSSWLMLLPGHYFQGWRHLILPDLEQ